MALSYVAASTYVFGTAAITPGTPTGTTVGDYVIIDLVSKYDTAVLGGAPSGWDDLGTAVNTGRPTGVDNGNLRSRCFGRVWQSGDTMPSLAPTPNNVSGATATTYRSTNGSYSVVAVCVADDTTGSPLATGTETLSSASGDIIHVAAHLNGDAPTWGNATLTATGATLGTFAANAADSSTTSGTDLRVRCRRYAVTAGSATTVSYSNILAGTTTNAAGTIHIVRVREAVAATDVSPTGIATAEAFGSPSISITPASQTATPTGVGSLEAFGSPTISQTAPPSSSPPTVTWYNMTTGSGDWDTSGSTTRQISVPGEAGDRLLVVAAVENGTNNWAATPVTNDGTALTWTQQEVYDGGTTGVMVGSWSATLDTTRTIVITVTQSATTYTFGAGCYKASGSDGFGASEIANNGTGSSAPSLGITTTQDNSAICCLNADWNAVTGARTYRQVDSTNPTEDRYDGTAGINYIVEAFHYADAGTAGPQTVGMTAPSTQRWALIGVEIKGTQSSAPTIIPTAISSAEAFGTVELSSVLTSSPDPIVTAETFGTLVATLIPPPTTLNPAAIATLEAFGDPTLTITVSSTPTGIASAEAFGSPALTTLVDVSPTAIASYEAFGSPNLLGLLTSIPSAIASAEAFGIPVIQTKLTSSPNGIASGFAAGSPSLTTILNSSPNAITSAEAFGSPILTTLLNVTTVGIASAEAFGEPFLSTLSLVVPTSIVSAETFGSPSILQNIPVVVTGIPTAEGFGNPSVLPVLNVSLNGIPTAQMFGNPAITTGLTSVPNGIASQLAFGSPVIQTRLTVSPTGIATAFAAGSPVAHYVSYLTAQGIASAEAFGQPSLSTVIGLVPTGIVSGFVAGQPTITSVLTVSPDGIVSLVSFGSPILSGQVSVTPVGILSAEQFGLVRINPLVDFVGWGIPIGINV